jgi:hypothetical protein
VHGLNGDGATWEPLAEKLAGDGWHVTAVDLRGHGAAGPGDDLTLEGYASDLPGTGWDLVVGHSLGGAVATLAAAYLRAGGIPTELYTYGAPRVGNEEFANFVSRQAGGHYRITHGADPVPKVPPFAFGYRHTTPEYWLNGGSSRTIDYGIRDIKVCTGTLSFACNNGPDIPDAVSHMYYINDMGGCSPGGFDVRISPENAAEVDAAFDRIIAVDRKYIEENKMPSNSSMTV